MTGNRGRHEVSVVVVGGGLAGLAAALECADAGATVSVFESRRRLGGATFSIRRGGYWLDNGQHVALRCCTAYRGFLRRLGVESLLDLQPRLRIPVLAPGGRRAVLDRTSLPAPLHLLSTLSRYRHLSPLDRAAAARAAFALRALDPADASLDAHAFGPWLRAHGQSDRAVRTLWNLIALPTLNLSADEASLMLAAKVFRTGLLDQSDACDVGVPSVPLQRLHGDAADAALRSRGVRIETGATVRRVVADGGRLAVQLGDALETTDAVVAAVPPQTAVTVLPRGLIDRATVDGLGSSPIVNVHLHYDRRVLGEPFAAAVDSPVQWIFDRTAASGIDEGQLVSISISGADDDLPRSRAELLERYVPAVSRLLPRARGAVLLDAVVLREPRATFRGAPGTHALRPQTRTDVPGLFLAGAWTDTGWPATMEGAVRSGVAAARAALAYAPLGARLPARRLELAV